MQNFTGRTEKMFNLGKKERIKACRQKEKNIKDFKKVSCIRLLLYLKHKILEIRWKEMHVQYQVK